MFPVISMLRRSAMKIIYTETPKVVLEGSHLYLNLVDKGWLRGTAPAMVEISVTSENPYERAVKLCVQENNIYGEESLDKLQYTLLLGREIEVGNTRVARIGVLKGIFTTRRDCLIRQTPSHDTSSRRSLPEGVVLDVR